MSNLIEEAERYYVNLAPHVREREGAKLIDSLLARIKQQEEKLAAAEKVIDLLTLSDGGITIQSKRWLREALEKHKEASK